MKHVGDGTRALNFFIDTILVWALAYFAFHSWNWYVEYWGYTYYNFGWFFFGMIFVYYSIFESIFSRTPGKWFTMSKVVSNEGRKPTLGRILIRNLTRIIIIDMFLIPALGKPLHDYTSGTTVVAVS